MIATWQEIDLEGLAADPGWHYDDPSLVEKLAASLRRHGQLSALVVRTTTEGSRDVVDGRHRLKAMRLLGWTRAWAADVGTLDDEEARRMALDLLTVAEVDYAQVAQSVRWLVEDRQAEPGSLAAASPFTAERVSQLARLASFDWDQFKTQDDGQHGFSWGDMDEAPISPVGSDIPLDAGTIPQPDTDRAIDVAMTLTEILDPAQAQESADALLDAMVPIIRCPGCGIESKDYDGLGFVACTSCGLCTHPSRDGGVCGLCGDVESLREAAPAVLEPVLSTVQMGLF